MLAGRGGGIQNGISHSGNRKKKTANRGQKFTQAVQKATSPKSLLHGCATTEAAAGGVIPVARPEFGARTHLLVRAAVLVASTTAATASRTAKGRTSGLTRGRVKGCRLFKSIAAEISRLVSKISH